MRVETLPLAPSDSGQTTHCASHRDAGHEFADNGAGRVAGVGDAEKDLDRAGVILAEPALERCGGGGVAAFERFEQGDGRGKGRIGDAPVEGKPPGGEPLPKQQGNAQQGQDGESGFEAIHRRKTNRKSGVGARNFMFGMLVQHEHAVWREVVIAGEGVAGEVVVHRLVKLDAHG